MAYSGVINWGPVVAEIVIHDVIKTGDQITSAVVDIIINGQNKVLPYEPGSDLRRRNDGYKKLYDQ